MDNLNEDDSKKRYDLRPRNRFGKAITAKPLKRYQPQPPPTKRRKRARKPTSKRTRAGRTQARRHNGSSCTPSSSENEESEESENESEESENEENNKERDARPTLRALRRNIPAHRSSSSTSQPDEYLPRERTPQSTMDDLAGLDDLKQSIIHSVVLPFVHMRNAKLLGLQCPRGVLFTGRPGTGKTVMADAIVDEIRRSGRRVRYFHETGECLSKYVGETEAHVRDLFRMAHETGPSVIFLDELDGLGRRREGTIGNFATSLMTTLLTEINNVKRGRVLLLAATNCETMVDPALIRKGRFDRKYQFPTPNRQSLREIFEHYVSRKDLQISDEDIDDVIDYCMDGIELTGCEIESLVNEINRHAVNRVFPNGEWCRMSPNDLRKDLLKVRGIDFDSDIYPALLTLEPVLRITQ